MGNVDIKQDAMKWEVTEKGRLVEKFKCNEIIKFTLDIKMYLKLQLLAKCKAQFFFSRIQEKPRNLKEGGRRKKKYDKHGWQITEEE